MAIKNKKTLKVLMCSRATLFSHPGGDTVQIIKTAEYLNKNYNIQVDIKTVDDKVDFNMYDLLHLFNITRPSDFMGIISESRLPYVVSTIFVDFSETENNHYKTWRRQMSRFLSFDQLEYVKTIARVTLGQERITDYKYIFYGQKNSIKNIIRNAKILLPNSLNEYKRLVSRYNIEQKYRVVPNAIDVDVFSDILLEKHTEIFNDAVISVGQITPVKNHLNLIKALNDTKYDVFIIGSPSSNSLKYFKKCKKLASDNIKFIPFVDQKKLVQIYRRAKVHVLASWFETTGLVSLEAGYLGCNIVITKKGDQEEYFKNDAYYCDPENTISILEAVNKAYESEYNKALKQRITDNFTWDKTAQKTFQAYKEVMQ